MLTMPQSELSNKVLGGVTTILHSKSLCKNFFHNLSLNNEGEVRNVHNPIRSSILVV